MDLDCVLIAIKRKYCMHAEGRKFGAEEHTDGGSSAKAIFSVFFCVKCNYKKWFIKFKY